jgi:hypothetical protein
LILGMGKKQLYWHKSPCATAQLRYVKFGMSERRIWLTLGAMVHNTNCSLQTDRMNNIERAVITVNSTHSTMHVWSPRCFSESTSYVAFLAGAVMRIFCCQTYHKFDGQPLATFSSHLFVSMRKHEFCVRLIVTSRAKNRLQLNYIIFKWRHGAVQVWNTAHCK